MDFKKITLSVLFICVAMMVQAQTNAIDKYFSQYAEDERFTAVFVSPKFFNIMDQVFSKLEFEEGDVDKEEIEAIMDIAKDMKELRVLTTDVTPDVFYNEARQKINTKEYETLMTVRAKGKTNVDIYIKEGPNNTIQELLLFAGGTPGKKATSDDEEGFNETDFVIISFVGNIQLDKVSDLINKIDK